MASLTIRNLEEPIEARLRERAARNGRSIEEEARQILRGSLPPTNEQFETMSVADTMYELFGSIGGFDLPERQQDPIRDPPSFE